MLDLLFIGAATLYSIQPATASAPATQPAALVFTLELPPGVKIEDNAAYEQTLVRDAAERIRRIAAATPQERRGATLDAVIFLLNRRCEPALSRIMQGIATPEDGRTLIDTAQQARDLLSTLPAAASAESNAGPAILLDVDFLAGAARVYAALGAATDPAAPAKGQARHELMAAGGDIAAYVDDASPIVANWARLFQAACYRRAGRADRAIELLGPPGLQPGAAPFDVFARLEHCRALADSGMLVAADAMAIRLESRTAADVEMEHRTAITQSFRALRICVLNQWKSRAGAGGREKVDELIDQRIKRLQRSLSSDGPVALYRFGHTLPGGQ